MFMRRAMPRPEIARIICIDSVGDCRELARARERVHLVEELVLTVVAAVRVVGDVQWIFQFVRFDEFVTQPGGGNKSISLLAIVPRKTSGKRCDSQRALPQHLVRRPGKISRISSAGKRYEHGIQPAQSSRKFFLLGKRMRRIHCQLSGGSCSDWQS